MDRDGIRCARVAVLSELPRRYACRRARSRVAFDADFEAGEWSRAPWSEEFIDIVGESPAALRTRVKMLWDEDYFYVGAEMEEPHIWATLTERDSVIFQDNDFEIFIDPDGDHHQYYEFEINALNTVWDLLLIKPYRDGGPAVHGWDIAGVKHAAWLRGTLNDSTDIDGGWSVCVAFPWAALRECAGTDCPPRSGDVWRVNFSRVEWDTEPTGGGYRKIAGRPEHNWVWSPQGVVDMHRPEMWGLVEFCEESAEFTGWDERLHAERRLMAAYARLKSGDDTGDEGIAAERTSAGWVATLRTGSADWMLSDDSRFWRAT
jgi:hypothetical protein